MGTVSSERLTIGVLFVAIALMAALAPVQSDTWWHLRSGQDVWATGIVPLHDTYSYTATGRLWPNHGWLTGAIFYGAWSLGGLPLMQLLATLLILGAMAIGWRLTGGSFEARFLIFAASLVASTGSWAVRPQVFSLFLFALTCHLLASGRWIALPVIFVLWTNLHGAVALGVVAVFATLGISTLVDRRVDRRLAAIAALSLLATGVSPMGFGLWTEIPDSIQRSQVNQLIEWRATDLAPSHWPFWAIAAVLPFLVFTRRSALDSRTWRLVGITLALMPLAIRAVRNVPMFLLAAVPALSLVMAAGRVSDRPRRPVRERTAVNAALLGAAIAFGVVFIALVWTRPPASLGWTPIAPAAMSAVRACEDPMYNTFEQGGMLIWFVPEKKVFLDNRQDPYPADLLRDSRAVEISGEYGALFRRFRFRCAVVPPESPTGRRLREDPSWHESYADAAWAVFTPRAPAASR